MPYSLSRLAMWVLPATFPLTLLPKLPAVSDDLWLIVPALALFQLRWRWTTDLSLILLLFLWAIIAARTLTEQINALEGKTPDVTVGVETVLADTQRVKLRIVSVAGKIVFPPIYATVSTQGINQALCRGQRWQAMLKLKPVHASLNEGGFDSQRFALADRTPLTGRIIALSPLNTTCNWRDRLIQRSREYYSERPWQGVLSALAFGERGEISREMTELLRATGTAHLMAISGMHISLAASVGWLFARALQLGFRAAWIGYRFPLFCSLVLALIYCWLAGANPPAVRALLAISIWGGLRMAGVRCSSWQVWRLCIGGILFFDPLSVLSYSLWLSGGAVAGLLLWFQWFPLPAFFRGKRRWLPVRLLHLQLGIFLLLMPAQLVIFHGISLSALLANIWAVPLVTMLTVPLLLAGLALLPCADVSQLFWWLADRSLELVFVPLSYLPSGWLPLDKRALWMGWLVWLLLLTWRFSWWRSSLASVVTFCLAIACWRLSIVQPSWRLDMLDIGHGLAVVISKQGEALVYDTGNRWPGGSAAESHVLPWLSWQGLQVRHIVLSHGHLDHIGGLASIQQAFPEAHVHSALGRPGHLPCRRGVSWGWQGLSFQALWPQPEERQTGNDQSCVLSISDGKWRVLLTGDVEAKAEYQLLQLDSEGLRADILQVPHHGSGTSSVPPLLRAVGGSAALSSAARYSTWKLPAKRVVDRYKRHHYAWYDTALEGQISVKFYDKFWQVSGLRSQIMPRWYHQWFGVSRYSR